MATVIAYDDVKSKQKISKRKIGDKEIDIVQTRFLGDRDNPNLPLIGLSTFGPGRVSTPHFHNVDQFQIMTEGKGKMGRHDICANSIHFSTAYTPYGPFTADAETSLTCLIIRVRPDTGAQHSLEDLHKLSQIPDRHPWQVTRDVSFPEIGAANVLMQSVAEIQNENGLATYTLSMKPNAVAVTPDPSNGQGLFVVLVKGSLIHDNRESKALTVVFVSNNEKKFEICAGPAGLEGYIVQFPRANAQSPSAAREVRSSRGSQSWQCSQCSFVYVESAGLPGEGIAPGTPWEEVPENWTCPDCAADKSAFERGGS